jgi:hypothetical protein
LVHFCLAYSLLLHKHLLMGKRTSCERPAFLGPGSAALPITPLRHHQPHGPICNRRPLRRAVSFVRGPPSTVWNTRLTLAPKTAPSTPEGAPRESGLTLQPDLQDKKNLNPAWASGEGKKIVPSMVFLACLAIHSCTSLLIDCPPRPSALCHDSSLNPAAIRVNYSF